MSTLPLNTDYEKIAEAVLRFSPRQQALLAGRIQRNLGKLVDVASKQVNRRASAATSKLTEDDIAREIETVRTERHARRK
ncbi:hypothetical protein [Hymenobacter properus]|uniref:Uncharacterized protein n=1 Tax=Hymenobacter properus TaxID=2791026 RepID=A0A931BJN2_9BACT|nr:hypothetical protein [Hymenobacter properus]MBF9143751.1 hypothetical protein [Hymenobacter properus]MBR7722564.1 hypothetical protein [Microvirga sp. SRT04]